ncbi:MAG: hypothetical protein GXP29_03125 [Planctomycetes bacterium]|nr:hypothetical protein [Planctomycetota bacterium]
MRTNRTMSASQKRARWMLCLLAAASFGVVRQSACIAFGAEELLRTVNFCFVFDCQNGLFGGVVDPCPDPIDDPLDGTSTNLFVDCPIPNGQ